MVGRDKPDNAGYLTDALALVVELLDCPFLLYREGNAPTCLAASPHLAGGTGSRLAGHDSLYSDLSLKLGHGCQDVGHEPAGWGR